MRRIEVPRGTYVGDLKLSFRSEYFEFIGRYASVYWNSENSICGLIFYRSDFIIFIFQVLPLLTDLHDTEVALRSQLKELGLNSSEKTNTDKKRKSKSAFSDEDLYECDVCRANLFVSMVRNFFCWS